MQEALPGQLPYPELVSRHMALALRGLIFQTHAFFTVKGNDEVVGDSRQPGPDTMWAHSLDSSWEGTTSTQTG